MGLRLEELCLPQHNKVLIREFFEQVWNQGSEAAIDRFIAENAGGNDPDFGMGREGFKRSGANGRKRSPTSTSRSKR